MRTRTHYTTTIQAFCRHPKAFKTTKIRSEVDCAKCIEIMGKVRVPAKEHPVYVKIEVIKLAQGWSWTILNKSWEINSYLHNKNEAAAKRAAVVVANRCRFTIKDK